MLIRDHVIETYKEFVFGIKKLLGEQIKLIAVSKIGRLLLHVKLHLYDFKFLIVHIRNNFITRLGQKTL